MYDPRTREIHGANGRGGASDVLAETAQEIRADGANDFDDDVRRRRRPRPSRRSSSDRPIPTLQQCLLRGRRRRDLDERLQGWIAPQPQRNLRRERDEGRLRSVDEGARGRGRQHAGWTSGTNGRCRANRPARHDRRSRPSPRVLPPRVVPLPSRTSTSAAPGTILHVDLDADLDEDPGRDARGGNARDASPRAGSGTERGTPRSSASVPAPTDGSARMCPARTWRIDARRRSRKRLARLVLGRRHGRRRGDGARDGRTVARGTPRERTRTPSPRDGVRTSSALVQARQRRRATTRPWELMPVFPLRPREAGHEGHPRGVVVRTRVVAVSATGGVVAPSPRGRDRAARRSSPRRSRTYSPRSRRGFDLRAYAAAVASRVAALVAAWPRCASPEDPRRRDAGFVVGRRGKPPTTTGRKGDETEPKFGDGVVDLGGRGARGGVGGDRRRTGLVARRLPRRHAGRRRRRGRSTRRGRRR